jgi:periplasmic protein CpxP/Spy
MNTVRMSRGVRRLFTLALVAGTVGAIPVDSASAQATPPAARTQRGTTGRTERGTRDIDQRVQRRIAEMLKERLSLSEDQVRQLEAVTRKLDQERRQVRGEEFRLRMALRTQLTAGDSASNDSIAVLLDRMPIMERRKIDLLETEQRELAQFLTPMQRAQYIAFQEEIRRSMDQIRERRSSPGEQRPSPGGARPGELPPVR